MIHNTLNHNELSRRTATTRYQV